MSKGQKTMLAVILIVVALLAALLVYTNFGQTSLFNPSQKAVGPGMSIETIDTTQEAVGPGMSLPQ